MARWVWAAAAVRGTSHETTNQRLQDAFSAFVVENNSSDVFCGLVSDGAGSASYGGQGASIACRVFSQELRRYFLENRSLPDGLIINQWIDRIRDTLFFVAEKRALSPRDFASTFVSIISTGCDSVVVHIGDGAVVIQDEVSGDWEVPSWPNHGEYASTTFFLTDENIDQLRIVPVKKGVKSIALFSDGLERLVLDFANRSAFSGFFNAMMNPLTSKTECGRDAVLSQALANYLSGEKINSRTDDDKTLILAAKK
jgi:hypothetical protein